MDSDIRCWSEKSKSKSREEKLGKKKLRNGRSHEVDYHLTLFSLVCLWMMRRVNARRSHCTYLGYEGRVRHRNIKLRSRDRFESRGQQIIICFITTSLLVLQIFYSILCLSFTSSYPTLLESAFIPPVS